MTHFFAVVVYLGLHWASLDLGSVVPAAVTGLGLAEDSCRGQVYSFYQLFRFVEALMDVFVLGIADFVVVSEAGVEVDKCMIAAVPAVDCCSGKKGFAVAVAHYHKMMTVVVP